MCWLEYYCSETGCVSFTVHGRKHYHGYSFARKALERNDKGLGFCNVVAIHYLKRAIADDLWTTAVAILAIFFAAIAAA